MKEILDILRKKGLKFVLAYAVCVAIYVLFDFVYMPYLAYKFGPWMFLPLYPSIVLSNFLGVFVYDWLGEDVLFLEFGSDWVQLESRELKKISFDWLSVFSFEQKSSWSLLALPILFIMYPFIFLVQRIVYSQTLERIRKFVRRSKRMTFVTLSIYPSPIGAYIFFRDEIGRTAMDNFVCMAKGGVFCTIAWGGLLGIIWGAIVAATRYF